MFLTIGVPTHAGKQWEASNQSDLYLGHSENAGTLIGWLFKLDPKSGEGSVYGPPFMRPLAHVKFGGTDGTRTLAFHSPEGAYRAYAFDGVLTDRGGFCGRLVVTTKGQVATQDYRLCADKLDRNSLDPALLGRYSNKRQDGDNGGDILVGEDLLLFSSNFPKTGVITFYNSELAGLTDTPLLLVDVDIDRASRTVEFATQENGNKRTYRLRLKDGAVILSQIQQSRAESLKKQRELLPIASTP
jgi:hypothetical protein